MSKNPSLPKTLYPFTYTTGHLIRYLPKPIHFDITWYLMILAENDKFWPISRH